MLAPILAVVMCLSICMSVCLCNTSVLYRNVYTDRADFFAYRVPSTYATLYFMEIRVSPKSRVLHSRTVSEIQDLENFSTARRPSARDAIYQRVTMVGLVLTTPCGDAADVASAVYSGWPIADCGSHCTSSSVYGTIVDLACHKEPLAWADIFVFFLQQS